MASTFKDRVKEFSAKNNSLQQTLSETDYAIAALEQQDLSIAELATQVSDAEAKVKALDAKVQKEYKDHEKYRDSHLRRLAHRVAGKKAEYDAKAAKEEQEYLEAMRDHFHAQRSLEVLQGQLAEAEKGRAEVEPAASRHKSAQSELDALYDSLFDGPTPEFPEEDSAERRVQEVAAALQSAQQRLAAERNVQALLKEASKLLLLARHQVKEAVTASYMTDGWEGDWQAVDYEQDNLSSALFNVTHAYVVVGRARRLHPAGESALPLLPQIEIPTSKSAHGLFPDGLATLPKMRKASDDLDAANAELDRQVAAAGGRESAVEGEVAFARSSLASARAELLRVRQKAVEEYVDSSAPPAYGP